MRNDLFNNTIHILFLLIICTVFNSCIYDFATKNRRVFEDEMVKSLNLKLITKDSNYQYSRLEIFNDTITGFWTRDIKGESYKGYFIQSVRNPKNKVEFNNTELRYPSISRVTAYRNGCLYFGKFGASTMQSLCSDGTLTDYFIKYEDTLFYANKVMLYKNRAVIASMNGIYVFDIKSQQLIWKHKFKSDNPKEGSSAIIGEKLLLTESIRRRHNSFTNVVCYDLDKLKIKWESTINDDADLLYDQEYLPHHHLYHDENNVIIPEINACYSIDINTGVIKNKVPWKGYFTFLAHNPRFNVENHRLYVNNYNDHTTLLCIDMNTNKKVWQMKNTYYVGLYKNYIVACTADLEFYLIINKITGRIKQKISKPKSNLMDFDFIDKYILINRQGLYM